MASIPKETRQWILTNPPTAEISLSGPKQTFTLHTNLLPQLKPDQVLLKTLYFSNDPAQRPWIAADQDPSRLYTTPVVKGEVMRAYVLGEAVDSTSERVPKGTHVFVEGEWAEYAIFPASACRPLQTMEGLSETHFLGALGTTGLMAYAGIKKTGRAGPGDVVVVSGAAGATGSMVVQIAKHLLNCKKVVGIAGSESKCRWVESLGAETCVNYKDADFKDTLWKATEDLVDVYFDNVGGTILDLMLTRMKRHGRIAACGVIENYNKEEKTGLKNWFEVVFQRLQINGFIVTDFIESGEGAKAVAEMAQAYKEGKIKLDGSNETVVDAKFEDVPKTWTGLFSGSNQGKLVTKLV